MFRRRLSAQLIACVGVVLFMAFAIFSYVELKVQETQMLTRSKRMAELLTNTMKTRLTETMLAEQAHKLPAILQSYASIREIEDVWIFDPETGEILIDARPRRKGDTVLPRYRALFERSPGRSELFADGERGVLSVVVAIKNDEECQGCHDPDKAMIGALGVDMLVDDTFRAIARNRYRMVGFTFVTLMGVSLVIAGLVFHLVNRPIQDLVGTMRRVEEGDLDAASHITGRGELGQLSQSFNSMIDRLRTEMRRLKTLYETASNLRNFLDLDERLRIAVQSIVEGLKFDRAAILLTEDGKKLIGKAGVGVSEELLRRVEIPLERKYGVLAETVIDAKPFTVRDGIHDISLSPDKKVRCWEYHHCEHVDCPAHGRDDLRCWLYSDTFCYDHKLSNETRDKAEICAQCPVIREAYGDKAMLVRLMFGSRAFVTVPLMAQDRAIGVIAVDNLHSQRPISDGDVRVLSIFAEHVGISIENAKLYRQLESRIEAADEELKQKIVALTEMKNFNDRILQNMSNGLITVDRKGEIVYFNAAAGAILECDATAAIGQPIRDVCADLEPLLAVPPDAAEDVESARPVAPYHEITVRTKTGREIPIEVAVSPMESEGGERTGVVIIFTDLTARKQMEEQVRRADKLATLGHLAAGLAHEIRNPLAGISGVIQILREDTPKGHPLGEVFDEIVAKVDSLEGSLRAFLQFARPTPPQLSPTDVNELVKSVIFLIRNQAEKDNVSVAEEYDEDLPIMMLDSEQIQQVVLNIALNALQALPDVGGTVRVRTYRTDTPPQIVIEVSDSGVGIPRERLDEIFNPYYTTKSEGTGLGLSIAQRIVEEHGGTIAVESEVGKGTTFRIGLRHG